MTLELVNHLNVNLKKDANLAGDKGYICNKTKKQLARKHIKLITPHRKNQKKHNTFKNKQILKLRFKVEVVFSHLKRSYKRLKMIIYKWSKY